MNHRRQHLVITVSLLLAAWAPLACQDNAPAAASAQGGSASPAVSDVSGSYSIVSATGPGGQGGYSGTATIAKRGAAYGIDWTLKNQQPYRGVGLMEGNVLGVGWGVGPAYGVVVYRVTGGTLSGRWASSAASGTETLEGAAGLSGAYKLTGAQDAGGKSYAGNVTIKPMGALYHVTWTLANESYTGVGIKQGDVLVVGWSVGAGAAGVVLYNVNGGKLDGQWAQPGGTAVGTEVLNKT